MFWIIKAPTNIAIPAKTLSIVLKKSRPCLIESACSAAASWALITFKFSESKFVISFFTSLISKLFSITTLIRSTSPLESSNFLSSSKFE